MKTRYFIRCGDGTVRHREFFAHWTDAEQWARCCHDCAGGHTLHSHDTLAHQDRQIDATLRPQLEGVIS